MAKYLVIVESPAKVKTIKKFLGKNYEVMASNGHVRDLPKSSLGIDVDGDFEPVSYTHLDVYKRQVWIYMYSPDYIKSHLSVENRYTSYGRVSGECVR